MKDVIQLGTRSFSTLSSHLIYGAIILLLFSSAVLTGLTVGFEKRGLSLPLTGQIAFGLFPKNQPAKPVSNAHFALSLTHKPKANMVKITLPAKNQQVPVSKDLVISGTSAGNINSSSINCQVFVIVNGIKPYQLSSATGPNGAGDYSKWSFTLTAKYTSLKEGQNKLTAKFSCANSSTSFHNSLNVTGVAANANATIAKS
jgi:hypothetical protein